MQALILYYFYSYNKGSNRALLNMLQKKQKNLTLIQKNKNFAYNTQKFDFD